VVDVRVIRKRRARFRARPVTTFSTLAGRPASSAICAARSDVSGVSSAGFRTHAFPAASAGAIVRANSWIG
jgi:hypothetical protein